MNRKKPWCYLTLLLLCASVTRPSAQQQPRDIGLREQAERLLVQLDVSVSGAESTIASLTKDDFELIVMGRTLDDFIVDRVCHQPTLVASDAPATRQGSDAADDPAIADKPLPVQPRLAITYMFYFDQSFLTQEGRIRSMDMARQMIPELVKDGNRATIVSSGRNVTTYANLTNDVEKLLAGIDEMENHRNQWWDPTARPEELQIREVLDTLYRRGADEASSLAKLYQSDERWRAEKGLRRFSMVLGRLTDVPQPKAILYFSDRMRSNPGAHYLSYFSNVQIGRNSMLQSLGADSGMSALSFDRVVNEANASGARLYTIQAEGMTGMGNIEVKSMSALAPQANSGTRHITDAQNTLVSFAAETGGQAFLRGVSAKKITRAVIEDMSCIYLLSFDAGNLPRNSGVPVLVRVSRDGVKVHHRGQVFIQSREKRLTSRLMAAFAAPDAVAGEGRILGTVVPTGYVDGKYTAMVQVGVEGSPLPGASWDIGISLLSRGKVREDASDHVQVSAGGTPVIFEALMTFSPGPFEIVMVAHETTANEIATGKIEGSWPDLNEGLVTVGPIAVMQPEAAVYLRGGEVKLKGAAGYRELLKPSLPTVMITLICWDKDEDRPLRIDRELIGESTAEFQPMQIQPDETRCAQIRDVIRADTMTDGEFTYRVRVFTRNAEVAVADRKIVAYGGAAGDPAEAVSGENGAGS